MTIKYPKGSKVRCIVDYDVPFTKDKVYTVREDFKETSDGYGLVLIVEDDRGSKTNGWGQQFFEAVKKPKTKGKGRSYAHSFSPGGIPEQAFQNLVSTGSALVETKLIDGWHTDVLVPAEETYSIKLHSKLRSQVGGDHYNKLKIQPLEYILANDMPFSEGAVVKYITRWRDKGGILDLQKIIQTCEVLIEDAEMYGIKK